MKAFVIYCDTYQLIPSERICDMVYDLTGHSISEGTLYSQNEKLFQALQAFDAQVKSELIASPVVNFDESGLRAEGRLHWLHSASTDKLTHYTAHTRRGKDAMDAQGILPGFKGVAVHDGWGPYWTYQCDHALCNVHHERDLKAVAELDGQSWAKDLIEYLHAIKGAVDTTKAEGKDHLEPEQISGFTTGFHALIQRGLDANPLPEPSDPRRGRRKKSKARNLLERLQDRSDSVLLFMNDFRVPYSNNQAEQDIRMIKVQQKISGTFRRLAGAQQFCRIRGYISTLKKRGLPVLDYIQEAFEGNPFLPQSDP